MNEYNPLGLTKSTYSDSNGGAVGSNTLTGYWDYWQGTIYPNYIYPTYHYDRGERAFKVLSRLVKEGMLKVDTVTDFIKAMDIVLSEL